MHNTRFNVKQCNICTRSFKHDIKPSELYFLRLGIQLYTLFLIHLLALGVFECIGASNFKSIHFLKYLILMPKIAIETTIQLRVQAK